MLEAASIVLAAWRSSKPGGAGIEADVEVEENESSDDWRWQFFLAAAATDYFDCRRQLRVDPRRLGFDGGWVDDDDDNDDDDGDDIGRWLRADCRLAVACLLVVLRVDRRVVFWVNLLGFDRRFVRDVAVSISSSEVDA